MKASSDHSPLDKFLGEILRNSQEKFQPVDWSEIEVLLRHDPRPISIPVKVDKRTMLIGAAAAGALVLIFGIYKIAQHFSSGPSEPDPTSDTTQQSFSTIDPVNGPTIADSSVLNTNSPKSDSLALFAAEKRKADSLAAIAVKDSLARVQPGMLLPIKTKDKKKKADTTLKTVIPDTLSIKPLLDTITKQAPKEPLIESPAAPDTANKKAAPENVGLKKKKSKSKKNTSPATEPKTDVPVAPPDSLKR